MDDPVFVLVQWTAYKARAVTDDIISRKLVRMIEKDRAFKMELPAFQGSMGFRYTQRSPKTRESVVLCNISHILSLNKVELAEFTERQKVPNAPDKRAPACTTGTGGKCGGLWTIV